MDERSAHRRSPAAKRVPPYRNKRILAVAAALITAGAFVAVAQVANAGTWRHRPPVAKPCPTTTPPTSAGGAQQGGAQQGGAQQGGSQQGAGSNEQTAPPAKAGDANPPVTTETKGPGDTAAVGQNSGVVNGGWQNGHQVNVYPGDQGVGGVTTNKGSNLKCAPASGGTASGGASPSASGSASAAPVVPIQDSELLGTDCSKSKLQGHTGFQDGNRCVNVAHGEVPDQDHAASVLFVGAPRAVQANQAFVLKISSRNIQRDRFLAAKNGGYYREISVLVADGPNKGIVRGHLHVACEKLARLDQAPDRAPVPAFFVAVEDKAGGVTPDIVSVNVPGLAAGFYSCGVWAGDASHRSPMAQRANQRTAFDAIRLVVGNGRG
jgi:hypothetical protein